MSIPDLNPPLEFQDEPCGDTVFLNGRLLGQFKIFTGGWHYVPAYTQCSSAISATNLAQLLERASKLNEQLLAEL